MNGDYNEVITRFQLEEEEELSRYYVKSRWYTEEGFEMWWTDMSNVWVCNVSIRYIETVLKPQGMTNEEYITLLKKAISTQDTNGKQFTYRLRQSTSKPNHKELTISILLEGDTSLKCILVLVKVQNSMLAFEEYFDWLIGKYEALDDHNQQLKTQNISLQSQFNGSIDTIQKLKDQKNSMEKELYSNFVTILNEKKKKIKELKSKVQSLSRELNNVVNNSNNNNNNNSSQSNIIDPTTSSSASSSLSPLKTLDDLYNNNNSSTNKNNTSSSSSSIKTSTTTKNTSKSSPDKRNIDKLKRKSIDSNNNQHSMTQNTSIDLLSIDDYYKVPNIVRKRFKPQDNNNNNQTDNSCQNSPPMKLTLKSNIKSKSPMKLRLNRDDNQDEDALELIQDIQ